MLRLILMTLVGLFGVLAMFGTPELAGSTTIAAAPAATAPAPDPEHVIRAAVTAPAPTGASPEELVRAALTAHGAHAGPRFDGPPLKPSPEYASGTAAAVVMAEPAEALYVSGSSVNMRSGPSPEAGVVAALGQGTAVTPVGATTGAWIEVEDADGNHGFVSARYLSKTQPG